MITQHNKITRQHTQHNTTQDRRASGIKEVREIGGGGEKYDVLVRGRVSVSVSVSVRVGFRFRFRLGSGYR